MSETSIIAIIAATIAIVPLVYTVFAQRKLLKAQAESEQSSADKTEADTGAIMVAATNNLILMYREELERKEILFVEEIDKLRTCIISLEVIQAQQEKKLAEQEQQIVALEKLGRTLSALNNELTTGIKVLSDQLRELKETPLYFVPPRKGGQNQG